MDQVAPGEVLPKAEREQRPGRGALDALGPGLEEVRAQRPLPLEIAHSHLVPALDLPTHLLEHVHLGAAHVERGENVEDLQRAPEASSASR